MRNASAQYKNIMVGRTALRQPCKPHVRHAKSGRPALRFAHDEVTEHLHARDRLQLFRIDEIGVELDRVRFAEQLHEPALFLDQIIRQRRDAEALLAGAHEAMYLAYCGLVR